MIFTIFGNIPNKKDLLRPGRKTPGKRGFYYDKPTKAAMNGIVTQLQAQWKTADGKQHPPLECASVTVKLFRVSGNFDPDGQLTTILDALKEAGVIVNDTAMRIGDERVIPCRVDSQRDEQTEVQICHGSPRWPLPTPRAAKRVPKAKQK